MSKDSEPLRAGGMGISNETSEPVDRRAAELIVRANLAAEAGSRRTMDEEGQTGFHPR